MKLTTGVSTFLIAVAAVALSATVAVSVNAPPPGPGAVKVSNISNGAKLGSFDIEWTPAYINPKTPYATYQFSVAPKGCTFSNTAPGPGGFSTGAFKGPTYKIRAECGCNRTYTPSVSTAPPDAYTGRSKWVAGPAAALVCTR